MISDELQGKLIDYLYGELGPAEREEVEAILARDDEARRAFEELRSTRRVLGAAEDEQPPSNLVFVSQSASLGLSRRAIGWGAFAAAAVLVLAFLRLDASVTADGFTITLNWGEPAPAPAPSGPTMAEFEAMQRRYLELTRDMIEASELRQEAVLVDFATAIEDQRRDDLAAIGRGMTTVGRIAEQGYRRSGVLIDHLMTGYGGE